MKSRDLRDRPLHAERLDDPHVVLLDFLFQPPGTIHMRSASITVMLRVFRVPPPHAERPDAPLSVRLDVLHQLPGTTLMWSASTSFMQHVSTSLMHPHWMAFMRHVSMTDMLSQTADPPAEHLDVRSLLDGPRAASSINRPGRPSCGAPRLPSCITSPRATRSRIGLPSGGTSR